MDVSSNAAAGAAMRPVGQKSQPRSVHGGTAHSFLALTALGVVFGDIGTSPLYAFSVALNATGHAEPTAADVFGVVSLIFWALMLIVSLKYVVFVLRADNDGEGGILALLSLVEHGGSRFKLPIAVVLGVIGASFLYGDGVITPAISVLSAIEGIKFSPAAANFVVPATLVILVALFAIQYRGTHSVGRLFGPVMVVWFVVIGVLGAVNICAAPEILTALSPVAAARLAIASPRTLFLVLGGVFLALTGGEALYADMGHVGRPAIRQAWFGLVLPALVLNYLGQGAHVLVDPQAIENPFYSTAPGWALIPLVLLAAVATVIASQALISGVFSMTRQAIQMGLCPRARRRADLERGSRTGLRADGELAAGGRHDSGRADVQDLGQSGVRLRHRGVGHDADHHAPALSRGDRALELAAGRRRRRHRRLRSDRSASSSPPIRSRSSRAAGFPSRSARRSPP